MVCLSSHELNMFFVCSHLIEHYRYNLGQVLESLGETDSATDSMATALQVEMVSPIMQYTSIPLPFD